MDDFAGFKKKSKKTKKVVLADDLDLGDEPTQPVAKPAPEPEPAPAVVEPVEPAKPELEEDAVRPLDKDADLTLKDGDDLDFSDLKKKKKKKAVAIDLDDVDGTTAPAAKGDSLGNTVEESASGSNAISLSVATDLDDFSDLKKKKKKSKNAFDMDAFEKELAATESGQAPKLQKPSTATKSASKQNSDDEADGADYDEDDDDVPEGEDPFGQEGGLDGSAAAKSKAELAADKQEWLSDPTRDYTYLELLGRFYTNLYASHPSLSSAGGKKRYTLAPPNVQRDGTKRSIFANVADICKKMHRQPEHVIQYLFAELGTHGSVDGSGRLVIKGRFQQKQIENVLRRYIVEYVSCKTCKSPDTLLEKHDRLYFVACQSCGSRRSVTAIGKGYQAQIGKRKKAAA
ncbi:uncharacterized protein L969DRAFT_94560 [Mixia osmundae IAM 14324]|uniref:Translation initiation factor IF2/IF5 domain-containing protein n=1 Tax=Mixia osmundae (strain CBS 9802 / IAM 14324 / JCM 22182 / KY 12970) TaxID=764103 RepID=G7E0W1_MIXOS|nr:uncharacterized protein L969DRAFT_94560 [Mixia osmundae IAM 14324]KEI39500.1 hypothetical protein L969DRAFT_94560 [Mixia osmundae IAM 14324]GAA96471.1 hypothetical protein E5Q_03138 [Mixia osmundae IAM 14324]